MDRPILSRIFTFFELCLIFLFGVGLILFTKDVSGGAVKGITLSAGTLIPSLFPFFVLSSFITSSGAGIYISKLFSLPTRYLFRLPEGCSAAIILGAIGGYPSGARTAFDLYDSGICSREECSRLLGFCSLCGPAFIFSSSNILFGDLRCGLVIWLSHIASAAVIGIVSSAGRPLPPKNALKSNIKRQNAFQLFTHSVSSSFSAMLNVCGFVIFFSAVMPLLENIGLFPKAPSLISALMRGAVEMTGGTACLSSLAGADPAYICAASAFIAGWGGLSVHSQVMSLRGDRDIPMGRYFGGKLCQGALSAAISYVFARRLPQSTPVWMPLYSPPHYVASPLGFTVLMGVYLLTAFLCSAFIVWIDEKHGR